MMKPLRALLDDLDASPKQPEVKKDECAWCAPKKQEPPKAADRICADCRERVLDQS